MKRQLTSLKMVFVLALIVGIMTGGFVFQKVYAVWGPTYFGRQGGYAYYTNQQQFQGRFMFEHGMPKDTWNTTPTTVDSFIASVKGYLADDSNPEQVSAHASVMINTMMGIDGDDPRYNGPSPDRWRNGVTIARSLLPTWESLVRAYDAGTIPGASVNWNDDNKFFPQGTIDGFGSGDGNNNTFLPDVVVFDINATVEKAITFTHPNGTVYTIKKNCGNLSGPESPFPTIVTPPVPPPPPTPPTRPMFKVTGGDIVTGASFATSTGATAVPCSAAPHISTAGLSSWNNSGTPDFAGAGDEYATYALGIIQEFATGQGTGQRPPGQEVNDLTFANKSVSGSVNVSAGTFGGMFGSAPCVDYWETKPVLSDLPNFGGGSLASADGVYAHTGNLAISGGNIPTGKHVTIYVEGNVTITGNITYANATWTNRLEIPSFKLIVHGSIFINANVTELNGTFAAIPDNGAATKPSSYSNPIAGTITTCSTGFVSYDPPSDGGAVPIDNFCGKQLTINGSVAAQQLWLLRANGSLASNTPAETINYTPETWLSIDPSIEITPNLDYQSIIGLPPVL